MLHSSSGTPVIITLVVLMSEEKNTKKVVKCHRKLNFLIPLNRNISRCQPRSTSNNTVKHSIGTPSYFPPFSVDYTKAKSQLPIQEDYKKLRLDNILLTGKHYPAKLITAIAHPIYSSGKFRTQPQSASHVQILLKKILRYLDKLHALLKDAVMPFCFVTDKTQHLNNRLLQRKQPSLLASHSQFLFFSRI